MVELPTDSIFSLNVSIINSSSNKRNLNDILTEAVSLARSYCMPVSFVYDGLNITACPIDSPTTIINRYGLRRKGLLLRKKING